MSARRTQEEMENLDLLIRPLYEQGIGCRLIGKTLCEDPALVFKRVRRMGIGRTREKSRTIGLPELSVPFTQSPIPKNLPRAAIGIATQWFLRRGYMASLPVEPTHYDLVVESDTGLQRVQVKSTTCLDPRSGAWVVHTHRLTWDPKTPGKRRKCPYTKENIDLFFVVTGNNDIFVIPVEAVTAMSISLDTKYTRFKQAP